MLTTMITRKVTGVTPSVLLPALMLTTLVLIPTSTDAGYVTSVTEFQTSLCSQRQTPGVICMSCDTLAVCVKLHNDQWETVPVELCDTEAGKYCNEIDGACSENGGSCNLIGQEGNFECNSPGIFPDPYSCRLYHTCFVNGNNLIAINMDCGAGAFSAATGDCSLPANDTSCRTHQYTCNYTGQMAAWPGNDNIFYICATRTINGNPVSFPRLYRCPSNEVFQNGRCEQRNWSGTGPLPPGNGSYRCERPGLFADPLDCRQYYACDNSLNSQHISCPAGTFFNQVTLSCVLGIC